MRTHHYTTITTWTGNTGTGTSHYKAYERNHDVTVEGKPAIAASSDPAFRGDKTRYNPEELFVASLSSCHMLWYLHLCSEAGVVITDYEDKATGIMEETNDGSGQFTRITLRPSVTVKEVAMIETAKRLHHTANEMCFLARSVKFPVLHEPVCEAAENDDN